MSMTIVIGVLLLLLSDSYLGWIISGGTVGELNTTSAHIHASHGFWPTNPLSNYY